MTQTASGSTNFVMEAALEIDRLRQEGEEVLGVAGWRLFRSYGRVMSGPYSGNYVSGLPFEEARRFIIALKQGQRVPVHLMHRHRSGNFGVSELSVEDGSLVMHYATRSEPAE